MHPKKRHGTYDAIINRVCRRCFRIPVKTKESTVEKRSKIVIKVAVADRFQLKVVPSIKNFYMMGTREVHYIGGTEVLPAPLDIEEEKNVLAMLKTDNDDYAKKMLIEHNLRLVVYIAKKFDNTGVGVEDLISIGTIGLIKAINQRMIRSDFSVTKEHGQFIEKNGILFMGTFHPAALLRGPQNKPNAFADFVALRDKIHEVCEHTYE